MLDLDEITYAAFREELKTAASLHGALSGAGAGLGLGALAGGAINAYRGYRGAREHGAGTVEALVEGAKGVPLGAAAGAAAGAGLGAAGGALSPQLGARLAATPIIGTPVRAAQRQIHGFTGWEPTGGIEAIGGGAARARVVRHAAKAVPEAAERGLRAAEEAQAAGLTSIPGYVQSLRRDPGGTLRKGFAEQWHNSGTPGKIMTFGLPALETAHAAVADEDPNGPGKGERIGRGLLSAGVGAVTGALPLAAQLAVGGAAGAVGGGIGRGIDRLRGRRPIAAATPPPYPHDDIPRSEHVVGPGMLHGGGGV